MANAQEVFLFTPLSISGNNLRLWLDAADPAAVNRTGSTLNSVIDKSPNNVNLGSSSGFTYQTNFNGTYPCFYNATRIQNFVLGSSASFVMTQPTTTFFVGCKITSTNYYDGYIYDGLAGDPNRMAHYGAEYAMYSGGVNLNGATTTTYVNVNVIASALWNTTASQLFLNGSLIASGSAGTGSTASGTRFGNNVNLNDSWVGNYCELLIYNRVLVQSEREQIEGYLAWKWGLQASLAANHPYRFYRPLVNAPFPTTIANMPYIITQMSVASPLEIPNLAVWIDGADSANMTLSGTSILQANDKSGNGRNATQVLANAPVLVSNSQNGRSGISFNGTNQCLNLPNFTSVPYTIFAVSRINTAAGNNTGLILNFTTGDGANHTLRRTVGTTAPTDMSLQFDYGGALYRYFAYNPYINDTNTHVMSLVLPGSVTFGQPGGILGTSYFDGAAGYNANGYTAAAGRSLTFVTIGAFAQTPTNSTLNGIVYELVWYNAALGDIARMQVENYLMIKWGLRGVFLQSAASWDPTKISGLTIWVDPTDSSKVQLSGTTINSITDKSTNANAFNQGTTKPTNTITLNKFQPMNFAGGSTNVLGALNNTAYNNVTQFSLFVVNRPTWVSGSIGYAACMFGIRSTSTSQISWHVQPNYSAFTGWNNSTTINSTLTISQNELNLFEVVQGASSFISYKNGNAVPSLSYTITGQTGLPASVGNSANGNGEGWQGQIGDVVFYNRVLTDFERQQVEGFLAWKWGLQGSLPAGHPYLYAPPPPI